MPQYSCACSSWRTTGRSSISSMRISTMGRSPEMLCDHSACGSGGAALDGVGGRARRGVGVQDVSGELLEEVGLRGVDAEVPQLHLRLGPGQRGGARVRIAGRDACRRARAPARDSGATQVQNAMRAVPPGGHLAAGNAARTPRRAPCRRCPTACGLRAWRAARATRGRGR